MNIIWLFVLIGMMAVTYSVRLLPFLVSQFDSLPLGVRRFLRYIPPAALGALIFPDSFSALPTTGPLPWLPVIGALGTAAVAYRIKPGIVIPVASSVVVIVTYLLLVQGAL